MPRQSPLPSNDPLPSVTTDGVRSVAFVSLGCPKNLVDSEKMLGLLAEDGIAITPDHAEADAIIINTCGFLEASKVESLEVIRQAIEEKFAASEDGRQKRVIVAGCLVQRHRAELLNEVPEVDALVGVFDRENIVRAVRGAFAPMPETARDMGEYHAVSTFISKPTKADIGKGYTDSDRARLRLTPRHYAYLRVSEGCNQGCTFCTIPSIRGRMRSKPPADIISEAQELIDDGAVELNLIGQDTTSYGTDIGYTQPGELLPGLIGSINRLRGLAWARLMYAYPSCFTDDMIKALADANRFVKYIDMPLQHINDQLLTTMRRKVSRKQIEVLLEKLRKWIPGMTIRTTMISGFPTETEAQHEELLKFIQDFQFDALGVFEFSPEPSTPAGRLHQTAAVPSAVATRRKDELMPAQQEIVFRKNNAMIGTRMKVLVDESNPRKKTAIARHAGQAPDIDGVVFLRNTTALPGELVDVTIEDFKHYDLIAKPTAVPIAASNETGETPRASKRIKMSLPVVGVVERSVESKGKRG
jgi:ribosomal protein S12 methylthiotransferase